MALGLLPASVTAALWLFQSASAEAGNDAHRDELRNHACEITARLPADLDDAGAARSYAELRRHRQRLLAETTLEHWLSVGHGWRRWDRGRTIAAHLEAAGHQELADYVRTRANNLTDGC